MVENQTVLNPFMGAGNFGKAALKLKLQFIGIEMDP
jgi:DNA modification methylase